MSVGKSFFGRKLHKDRPADRYFDENSTPDTPSGSISTYGSRSSRHSKSDSVYSSDIPPDLDNGSVSAVVVSPHDYALHEPTSPAKSEHYPRSDTASISSKKMPAKPQPYQLNRPGVDYHQYPAFPLRSHSPRVHNPKLSQSQTTVHGSTGDKGPRTQQWAASNPAYMNESANASRTSLDQASIFSKVSDSTRPSYSNHYDYHRPSGSSYAPSQDRHATLTSTRSPYSTYSNQSVLSVASPDLSSIDGQPRDERVVDQMFLDLMIKRGWQNLPEEAKRQMLAYPASKKRTLVHQDHLAYLQGEQKRKQHARISYGYPDGPNGLLSRADEEGSPEWYVKKMMDDSITAKQLESLSVSLRTQPIR